MLLNTGQRSFTQQPVIVEMWNSCDTSGSYCHTYKEYWHEEPCNSINVLEVLEKVLRASPTLQVEAASSFETLEKPTYIT
jgi:hypothetical protein